jgi:hypothetical protein
MNSHAPKTTSGSLGRTLALARFELGNLPLQFSCTSSVLAGLMLCLSTSDTAQFVYLSFLLVGAGALHAGTTSTAQFLIAAPSWAPMTKASPRATLEFLLTRPLERTTLLRARSVAIYAIAAAPFLFAWIVSAFDPQLRVETMMAEYFTLGPSIDAYPAALGEACKYYPPTGRSNLSLLIFERGKPMIAMLFVTSSITLASLFQWGMLPPFQTRRNRVLIIAGIIAMIALAASGKFGDFFNRLFLLIITYQWTFLALSIILGVVLQRAAERNYEQMEA